MQDPDHQKAKCAKCQADRGEPCLDRYGRIAEKVHYGRPQASERYEKWRPAKLRGGSFEVEINLEEFKVIADLKTMDLAEGSQYVPRPAQPTLNRGARQSSRRPSQSCGYCGNEARPYMCGWRCAEHSPAALAGRAIPGITE